MYLHPDIFDNGLSQLNARRLVICSQEPTTYAQANTTYALGNKGAIAAALSAYNTTGRRATIAAITDGAVTATGTASHWAIVDTATSRLLATRELAASQAVTNGNQFTLAAFDISMPGPV